MQPPDSQLSPTAAFLLRYQDTHARIPPPGRLPTQREKIAARLSVLFESNPNRDALLKAALEDADNLMASGRISRLEFDPYACWYLYAALSLMLDDFEARGHSLPEIFIGTIHRGERQVQVYRIGADAEPVILWEQGLIPLFEHVAYIGLLGADLGDGCEPHPAAAAEHLDYAAYLHCTLGHIDYARSSIPLPEPRAQIYRVMVTTMQHFVLAHECAHVALGHLDSGSGVAAIHFGGFEAYQMNAAWEREYEADTLGADVALDLAARNSLDPTSCILGIQLALWASEYAEQMEKAYRQLHFDETHPPAKDRCSRILRVLDARYPTEAGDALRLRQRLQAFLSPAVDRASEKLKELADNRKPDDALSLMAEMALGGPAADPTVFVQNLKRMMQLPMPPTAPSGQVEHS